MEKFGEKEMKEILLKVNKTANQSTSGIRLNINLPLSPECANWFVKSNNLINKEVCGEIDFTNSLATPHITIRLGEIIDASKINEVNAKIEEFSKILKPIVIEFEPAYIKEPNRTYIFCDVENNEYLNNIISKLDNMLLPYLLPSRYKSAPHVTINMVLPNADKLKTEVSKLNKPAGFIADKIRVNYCGKNGTCLTTIGEYSLNHGQNCEKR